MLDLFPFGQAAALQRVAEYNQVFVVAFLALLLWELRTEIFTLTDVVENVRVDFFGTVEMLVMLEEVARIRSSYNEQILEQRSRIACVAFQDGVSGSLEDSNMRRVVAILHSVVEGILHLIQIAEIIELVVEEVEEFGLQSVDLIRILRITSCPFLSVLVLQRHAKRRDIRRGSHGDDEGVVRKSNIVGGKLLKVRCESKE